MGLDSPVPVDAVRNVTCPGLRRGGWNYTSTPSRSPGSVMGWRPEWEIDEIDEESVLFSDVVTAPTRFFYQYDFGDSLAP